MSLSGKKPSFIEWIGFERAPDYSSARFLGPIVGAFLVLIGTLVAVGGLLVVIEFLFVVLQFNGDHEAIRNIGLVVAAVIGAPFVFWRAVVAQKQADTAEQSHITDQINKAVSGLGAEKTVNKIGRPIKIYSGKYNDVTHSYENLDKFIIPEKSIELKRYRDEFFMEDEGRDFDGWSIEVRTWDEEQTRIEWQGIPLDLKEGEAVAGVGDWSVFSESVPNIEVRVGAIYGLERIAQDSLRDHIQIMEILSAYIRENAPVSSLDPSEEPFFAARPRTDVQAAVDVIGRRESGQIATEFNKKYRLDLSKVDLSGVNFSNGNFEAAIFTGSRLETSNFRNTNLRAARMQGCLLNFAKFHNSNMCGAIIDHSKINRLDDWNASIAGAREMRGLSMIGSDISAIGYLPTDESHCPTFGTKDTKLADHMEEQRQKRAADIRRFSYRVSGVAIENEDQIRTRLEGAGFLYWSPFDSTDGATGTLRAKFWDEIGLVGFPFREQ